MKRLFRSLTPFLLSLAVFSSIETASAQAAVVPQPRVISFAPALTEIMYAIAAQNQLVGVSDYSDYPPAARSKPQLGGPYTLNTEEILALHPTLLLSVDGDQQAYARLARLAHARLVVLPTGRISQVFDNIREVGVLTGHVRQASRLVARMHADIARETRQRHRHSPSVFYMVWAKPLMTAGPGSYLDELVKLAGGRNVADVLTTHTLYPTYSWETLIAQDPDVILAPANLKADLAQIARTRPYLRAVRTRRLVALDADILSRPGPRLPQALGLIEQALYPAHRAGARRTP